MTDFRYVEKDLFAELNGMALVNVPLLERLCSPTTSGENLLERFSQSTEGDLVCLAGAVVPIIGITGEYYAVTIRSRAAAASVANPKKSSPGWVFTAEPNGSVLCGLGSLADWDPKAARHRQIAVPPGWYKVEFGIGFVLDDPNQWGVDFILDAETQKPEFTASLQSAFDLYLEDEGA